jgi:hypothetical protein
MLSSMCIFFTFCSFVTGISGKVFMDDNGDRDTSYSILDMNPVTGKFEVHVI